MATLQDMRETALFQYNVDIEDGEEYQPDLDGYVNEGYDLLLFALTDIHLGEEPLPLLVQDGDECKLPYWCIRGVADFATYNLYRNGNPQKQSRGDRFLQAFLDVRRMCEQYKNGGDVTVEDDGSITIGKHETPQFINVYP